MSNLACFKKYILQWNLIICHFIGKNLIYDSGIAYNLNRLEKNDMTMENDQRQF